MINKIELIQQIRDRVASNTIRPLSYKGTLKPFGTAIGIKDLKDFTDAQEEISISDSKETKEYIQEIMDACQRVIDDLPVEIIDYNKYTGFKI